MNPPIPRIWKLHSFIGAIPLYVWSMVHLWEQWIALQGSTNFSHRLARTSRGEVAVVTEILLVVAPFVLWIGTEVYARLRVPEPPSMFLCMAEDEVLARRFGWVMRVATWLTMFWLSYHLCWLWLPKFWGVGPMSLWSTLQNEAGLWPHAICNAVGLSAFALHLWAAFPRLAVAFDWVDSAQGWRSLRISAAIISIFLFLIGVELYGWHASGAGVLWPIGR